MEAKTENADRAIAFESAQECVVGNDKVGSLYTGNHDLGRDNVNNVVDMREIILHVKFTNFESTEVSGRGSGMKNKHS